MDQLKKLIRDVPNFPKPGIIFKDITPMLTDKEGFKTAIDALTEPFIDKGVELVVGVESRGFIFAPMVAYKLGAGTTLVRKPGKLPYKTVEESYELEYGTDTLQMHADAIKKGQKVLIVDDLLATGGTISATKKLVEKMGGEIVGFAFVVELDFLKGRKKLKGSNIHSLIHF